MGNQCCAPSTRQATPNPISTNGDAAAAPAPPPFKVLRSEWFASLDKDKQQPRVRAAVAGKSTELDLSDAGITHIPGGVFSTLTVLTTLHLGGCTSLTALPESLGQLRALTKLDLRYCTSLSAESRKRGKRLPKRNRRIRDGRALRFPMTTHDFAATVLFGSMLRPRRPSGDGADVAAGGATTTAAASASDGQADASLVRVLGAFPDCVLSKLNSHGPAFASNTKRLIADFCGVSFYGEGFARWVAEIDRQLLRQDQGQQQGQRGAQFNFARRAHGYHGPPALFERTGGPW